MADKKNTITPLNVNDIVLRADAQIIKQAYEMRLKVDAILKERAAAYQKIAALEQQVDTIVGAPGLFAFPEPPVPVSGYPVRKNQTPVKTSEPAATAAEEPANEDPEEK